MHLSLSLLAGFWCFMPVRWNYDAIKSTPTKNLSTITWLAIFLSPKQCRQSENHDSDPLHAKWFWADTFLKRVKIIFLTATHPWLALICYVRWVILWSSLCSKNAKVSMEGWCTKIHMPCERDLYGDIKKQRIFQKCLGKKLAHFRVHFDQGSPVPFHLA